MYEKTRHIKVACSSAPGLAPAAIAASMVRSSTSSGVRVSAFR